MSDVNLKLKDPSQDLPKPTYWPMFMGISFTLICWGLLTSWIVSAVGSIILLVSIVGWMKEVSK